MLRIGARSDGGLMKFPHAASFFRVVKRPVQFGVRADPNRATLAATSATPRPQPIPLPRFWSMAPRTAQLLRRRSVPVTDFFLGPEDGC